MRQLTDANDTLGAATFYRSQGLWYRKWFFRIRNQEVTQLVVPKACRGAVLHLAQDIPLAGHQRVQKTMDRVLHAYYWPGIFQDEAKYVQTCEVCQKSARKQAWIKAPLIPIPVIGTPFARVIIDIVGLLPQGAYESDEGCMDR